MIALLRGVNVGGVTIKSAQLNEAFRDLGFGSVRTVLASGNVAFDAQRESTDFALMARGIEAALSRRFGYEAKVVLITQSQLAHVAAAYPFSRADQIDHPYVIFSSQAEALGELESGALTLPLENEELAPGSGVLYWRVPKGRSLDTPFAKLLARSRHRQHLTTRNLRTVEKLTAA